MRKVLTLLTLLICGFSITHGSTGEFTGVRGRVALKGQTIEGVKVFLFEQFSHIRECKPIAVSEPSNLEGIYSLEVGSGKYWVVGYKGKQMDCPDPTQGDFFCFYGGNPVVVERGKPTNVGLSMIRVEKAPVPSGEKGISGFVYGEEGMPLRGATIYFYRGPEGGLRGLPEYFTRTDGKGYFRARIGRGVYFVVARKRKSGETFGPTGIGDSFGYYSGNPVEYDGKTPVSIRIDSVTRLSQLEKFEGFEKVKHGITVDGFITDKRGKPLKGYHVFAYKGDRSTGMPEYISGKSGEDGRFELNIFEEGAFTLVARERPGGPSSDSPSGKQSVHLIKGKDLSGVRIMVD